MKRDLTRTDRAVNFAGDVLHYTLMAAVAAYMLYGAATAHATPANVTPQVNVNTATLAQLQFLPGVGPAMVQRIVAARPFVSVEALVKVKGIKAARLLKLRPYVTVSGPTTATAKMRAVKP